VIALCGDATDASQQLLRAIWDEAGQWAAFAQLKLDSAVGGLRVALLPGGIERRVLARMVVGLDTLEGRVEERLKELENRAALPAQSTKPPFRGYDAMTAKQVASRLTKLDPAGAAAVAAYEQSHKARATVLKAAKARAA